VKKIGWMVVFLPCMVMAGAGNSAWAAKVTQELNLDAPVEAPVDAQVKHGQSQHSDFFDRSIKRLSKLPGFDCRFDQLLVFSDGAGKHYSGTIAVLKPKRFRWQYQQPYAQLYLGDGSVIWHYEPDLLQAERLNNLESVDSSVMGLLDGSIALTEIDMLQQAYDANMDIQRYLVRLKGSPEMWLGFSKTGDLIYIERQDLLGNSNQLRLSACTYVAPAQKLFSFTVPEGVDVIDMRQ